MTQSLHISVADAVFDEITAVMVRDGKKNRSEFVEELIRKGLAVYNSESDVGGGLF